MTNIIFVSPDNRDSRVQMKDLADDIYASGLKEYQFYVDIAEIPTKSDAKSESRRLANFIKQLRLSGLPLPLIIVAYEDYAALAIKAMAELRMLPRAMFIPNFPIANDKLFEYEDFQFLQKSTDKSAKQRMKLYAFQGDSTYSFTSEYFDKKRIDGEVVRMEDITDSYKLNYEIISRVKDLIK